MSDVKAVNDVTIPCRDHSTFPPLLASRRCRCSYSSSGVDRTAACRNFRVSSASENVMLAIQAPILHLLLKQSGAVICTQYWQFGIAGSVPDKSDQSMPRRDRCSDDTAREGHTSDLAALLQGHSAPGGCCRTQRHRHRCEGRSYLGNICTDTVIIC